MVAIDGPAGAGKSTVARAVAEALGAGYLDTGAMYRAASLADDPAAAQVDLRPDGSVLLAGEDVTARIRTPEVSQGASRVAADPAVRRHLVALQQAIVREGDWVAEGRDVGTVVAPWAQLKIFLVADERERARRRAAQLGREDVDAVLAEQRERDTRDEGRADSPLRAADDAVELDTTGLSVDAVVERIAALARERSA